jgi:hypothetical protein
VLTQSVEDLMNILSPLTKTLNDLYEKLNPTSAEKSKIQISNQQYQALKIQIEAQMYKVYHKRIEISESQLTYTFIFFQRN